MEEAYDLFTGLYDSYDDPSVKRPYAVVAYHPGEDIISGSLFERWVRIYMMHRIHESTGLSLGDFFNLDMLSVYAIYGLAREHTESKLSEVSRHEKELEKQLNPYT